MIKNLSKGHQKSVKAAGEAGAEESDARQALGLLTDALLLNQPISGARARAMLKWTPQAPSILEELEHGSYR